MIRNVHDSSSISAGGQKVYKKRFFVLATIGFLTMLLSMFQPHYSSITNVLTKFYGVSDYWINFISTSGLIVALVATVPMNWIAEKYGMKCGIVISVTFIAFASILIYIAIDPRLFSMAVISNSLRMAAVSYLHTCHTQVTQTWFPDSEQSYAYSSLQVINSVGHALGYYVTPAIAHHITSMAIFVDKFRLIGLIQSIITVLCLIIVVVFFESKPKTAPTLQREAVYKERSNHSLLSTLSSLIRNKNVVLLVISTSLVSGIFYTKHVLLNQLITSHFPNNGVHIVGVIGLMGQLSAMVGFMILGSLTKRYKRLRTIYSICNWFTLLSLISFVITFKMRSLFIYFTVIFCGLFSNCNAYLSMLLMAQLAHPHSEAITSSIVFASIVISPNLFTFLGTMIIHKYGPVACFSMFIICLLLAVIIDFFIIEKREKSEEEMDESKRLMESKI